MFKTKYVNNFREFYEEHKEDVEKHYQDFLDTYGGDRGLDIDFSLYQHLIDLGVANIFTLWEDSKFLGYVSVTISPSVLCAGYVDTVIDHLYFKEEARGKGYCKVVLDELQKEFNDVALDRYTLALPAVEPYGELAKALGFSEQSRIYVKGLGE